MADDLTFSIGSETTGFDNGIRRGVIEPLEDADKAIEKLAKTGDREMGELEDSMRDAQRDTERFKDEIKDVSDALTRVGRAGKKSGDDIDDGFDRARKGADEFKDEATSTAKEAAASFDGSAESIADAFQEVAANAFAGFGPAGVAAGIAAAAGLGFAMQAITDQQEAADELKRRFADMYQSAIEEGRAFLDEAQITAEALKILNDPDRDSEYQDALRESKQLNLDINDIVRARAGDEDKIRLVLETSKQLIEDIDSGKQQVNSDILSELGYTAQIANEYQGLLDLQGERKDRAQQSLDLEKQIAAEASAANSRGLDALAARGRALDDYYKKAANPPNPVVKPTVDMTAIDALTRRLNELNNSNIVFQVNVDGTIGRFLP